MLELIRIDQTMAHVYLGPPEMDETAANIIREALVTALNSEEFIAEAKQVVLSYAPQPVDFDTISEKILAATQDVESENNRSPSQASCPTTCKQDSPSVPVNVLQNSVRAIIKQE